MKEERHKKILAVLIALNRIFYSVNDRFFAEKIGKKTQELLEAYLDEKIIGEGERVNVNSVAQYSGLERLLLLLDNTIDLIEVFIDSNKRDLSPVIAYSSIKKLLILKLDVAKKIIVNRRVDKPKNLKTAVLNDIKKEDKLEKKLRMNMNKKRILEFVKSNPNSRAKDIVENFTEISDRTVKRNLSELLGEGFLNKKSENGGVYYF